MSNRKIAFYLALGFLFSASAALAAPNSVFQPTILPQSDNNFDLGSASDAWRNIYAHNLTVSGTCTGCGGGGGSGGLGTTTPWTTGDLAQVSSNGAVKSIATTSLGLKTTDVTEGSNLYFTNPRALTQFIANLAATSSVSSITALPALSLPYSQLTGKPTILTIAGSSGQLQYNANGALGAVSTTSLAVGTGLTNTGTLGAQVGGSAATIKLADTAVTPGSCTNCNLTVDQQGRITAQSNGASGGGGAIGTSTALANTQIDYSTSANTIANDSNFTYSSSLTKLTVPNASTTNLSIGALSGILKQTGGVVSAATGGTDYENPLTFVYPLVRSTNSISLGFSTTTLINAGTGISTSTSGGAITVTNTSPLSGLSAIFPYSFDGNHTLTWIGLATTSQPSSSNILVSNGTNGVYGIATTSVSCSGTVSCSAFSAIGASPITITGSAGSTGLSTSSPWTAGQLAYVKDNSTLTSIATGTISNGTGITVTAGQSIIGSGLTITNSSPLSALTAIFPYSFDGSHTLTWIGLATTSQPASSNILVSNGSNGIYGAATSTLSASSPLTGSFTQLGSGGSLGLGTVGYANGGTGTTTGPVSQLSYFGATSYQSVATTSVSCSGTISCSGFTVIGSAPITLTGSAGSSGVGTVSTSSLETAGQLPYWTTSSAYPAKLGGIATSSLAVDSSLSVSSGALGSQIGGSNATFGLNLGHANTWTALQTFANATTTLLSATYASSTSAFFGTLSVGALSGFLKATAGAVATAAINLASDITGTLGAGNGGTGATSLSSGYSVVSNVLSQVTYPSFTYATSSWTGTTTVPLEVGVGEIWNSIRCFTDVGTLNVQVGYGSASTTMFNASTTIGTISYSSNNTMTAGNEVKVDLGTPASSPSKITCTVKKTL